MQVSHRNLSSLREIAEVLNRSLDLREALHDSLEIIVGLLDLRLAWIFLENEEGTGYRLAAHHGLPEAMAEDGCFWKGGCQCNTLAAHDKLADAVNMVRCSRIERIGADLAGFTDHASVPLETPRQKIGIFNVVSRDGHRFHEEELALLTAVGNQMGVAIERATIFDRVRCQRVREQRALIELSSAMLENLDAGEALQRVTAVSRHVFDADLCIIGLENTAIDGHACFRDMAAEGLELDLAPDAVCDLLHGPFGMMLADAPGPVRVVLDDLGIPTEVETFPVEARPLAFIDEAVARDETLWRYVAGLGCRSVFTAAIKNPSCQGVIGQLFVLHRRKPDVANLEHLTALLANQAALAIQKARLESDRLQRQALESELGVARDIQRKFLPEKVPTLPGWQISATYRAASQVGGDFYDFIPLSEGRWGFAIGDVSGKGVPAALVMVLARTMMNAIARETSSPKETLFEVNDMILRYGSLDRFLSVFYAVLDPRTGHLRYGRAGHNPPFHLQREGGELTQLNAPGIVVGVTDTPHLEEGELIMAPGDRLVLYTDGVTEAMDAEHRDYGEARLAAVLQAHGARSARDIDAAIRADIARFLDGAPQSDDLTMVVLARDP